MTENNLKELQDFYDNLHLLDISPKCEDIHLQIVLKRILDEIVLLKNDVENIDRRTDYLSGEIQRIENDCE